MSTNKSTFYKTNAHGYRVMRDYTTPAMFIPVISWCVLAALPIMYVCDHTNRAGAKTARAEARTARAEATTARAEDDWLALLETPKNQRMCIVEPVGDEPWCLGVSTSE